MSRGDVYEVAERLGLHTRGRRWGPCPACHSERAGRGRDDPRAPLKIDANNTWFCTSCGANGGPPDLVGWYILQCSVKGGHPRMREVMDWIDGRTVDLAPDPEAIRRRIERARARRAAEEREAEPPPRGEVESVLRRSTPLEQDAEVAAYLHGRGIDAARAPGRVLPAGFGAWWWPSSWSATWRIVVGAFDGAGQLRTLHARAARDVAKGEPKTRWPKGCGSKGSLFMTRSARALVRGSGGGPGGGEGVAEVRLVLITEGLTDFLHAGAVLHECPVPVIGYESGADSAVAALASRLPLHVRVCVATDDDEAGEKYAARILSHLPRHECVRVDLGALLRRGIA